MRFMCKSLNMSSNIQDDDSTNLKMYRVKSESLDSYLLHPEAVDAVDMDSK